MDMKRVGLMMTVLMGITMSLVLSFVGTFTSGHFSLMAWLFSFTVSLVVSLVIGFTVPVKRICDGACNKCGLVPESFKGNLFGSLISDLIYTPVITLIMVVIGVLKRLPPDASVPLIPIIIHAFIPSLIKCLIVGYVVIVVAQPLFIKMLVKNAKRP